MKFSKVSYSLCDLMTALTFENVIYCMLRITHSTLQSQALSSSSKAEMRFRDLNAAAAAAAMSPPAPIPAPGAGGEQLCKHDKKTDGNGGGSDGRAGRGGAASSSDVCVDDSDKIMAMMESLVSSPSVAHFI